MAEKELILAMAPNDSRIAEAVQSWEERGYTVQVYPLTDLHRVTEDLMGKVQRYNDVRLLFTESAYGNIPYLDRRQLLNHLWIELKVRWIHLAKMFEATSDSRELILVASPHDLYINKVVRIWKKRDYNVIIHILSDPNRALDDLITQVQRYHDVRLLISEQAYNNIPYDLRQLFADRLWIEPRARWLHLAKQKEILDQ